MGLTFTARARADLVEIARSIARANPQRAMTVVAELEAHCEKILRVPFGYVVFKLPNVRRAVHGNYLIFFRVGAASVQVLRVLHGKRDLRQAPFGTMRGVDDAGLE